MLKFCLELLEQLGVRIRVNFASQDLLGTLDSQGSHFATQTFTYALHFLVSVLLGLRNNAGFFGFGFTTSLLQKSSRLFFSVDNALMVFGLGRSVHQADTRLGLCQIGLAFIGSSQTISDFLTTIIDCFRQWRPYEFHRKPGQNEKHDHLKKESRV
ncbi:hypothetical protein RHDC4_02914 [Rhodocyclaceae bacterium]|nr:hypothetical protein RHDC4_02914 [Rhodocyclaceae bacterium]